MSYETISFILYIMMIGCAVSTVLSFIFLVGNENLNKKGNKSVCFSLVLLMISSIAYHTNESRHNLTDGEIHTSQVHRISQSSSDGEHIKKTVTTTNGKVYHYNNLTKAPLKKGSIIQFERYINQKNSIKIIEVQQ